MTEKEIFGDEDLERLMKEIIDENKMDHLVNIKILPVYVSPEINKTTISKIMKCNNEMSHFSDSDFIIEVSHNVWQVLTPELKKITMMHQLLHVHQKVDKKGNVKLCIRKHDTNEFSQIIESFGAGWMNELKTIVSSFNDFENGEQDNVKI